MELKGREVLWVTWVRTRTKGAVKSSRPCFLVNVLDHCLRIYVKENGQEEERTLLSMS